MVFALGFFTAGLLALACLPAVWRRAMRLTARRLGQLVPLSMEEIVAGRDQLRAGFAVDQRRLEQKLADLETARSQALIEVGRRDVRILALEDEMARERARTSSLTQELGETTRELFGLRGEAGAAEIALFDLEGLAEQRRWQLRDAEEKIRSLENVVDEGRATIAALETRILGLETRAEDLDQELGQGRKQLAATNEALARTMGERDAARQAAEAIAGKRDAVQLELEARIGELTGLRAAMEEGSGTAKAAERRAGELAEEVAALQAKLDRIEAEHRAAQAGLETQVEAARNQVRASATTIEELRAEKAALSNALAVARQGRGTAPAGLEQDGELATLRQAIKQVADDVLRMATPEQSRSGPSAGMPTVPAGAVQAEAAPASVQGQDVLMTTKS